MMRTLLFATIGAAMLVPATANAQSAREVRHDQRELRQDRHEIRHDVQHGRYAEARHDRREYREDRRERNEDWRDYRRTHRSVYHRAAYVGPRGYRYRPVAVGYRFAPAYYSSRYWVNDWSHYRLARPAVNQRWVRYGNDVLLINVRTGHVVRVYSGFFW